MKHVKQIAMMMLLFIGASGFSQIPSIITYNVNAGSCVSSDSGANNWVMTNAFVVQPSTIGTISVAPATGSFIYCAPGGIVGTDTTRIYGCVTNGIITFPICDTFTVVFNILGGSGCNFPITLGQDSFVCVGGNRSYSVLSIGGNPLPPFSYLWSDGTTAVSACELNPGQGICVTVTDANGCVGSACSNGGGCNLALSFSPNICAGPLPSVEVVVSGGTPPYTYYWSSGDSSSVLCNLQSGVYCLSVFDINGCVGSGCYTVSGPGNCGFNYTLGNNPVNFNEVSFFSYTDSSVTPVAFEWSFGDGGFANTSNPVHIYNSSGNYNVVMNVYYSNGDSCSFGQNIFVLADSVNYPLCQTYFYSYIDSANSNTFHFVDYSAYFPTSWAWDFGDGTFSTQQNPIHTYSSQGTWTVCLTTTDASGCSSNFCQQISNVPVQDLQAYLFHQTTVTPGFPVWVSLSYYNSGTILVNGTVTYRYPAGTTVSTTSITPSAHNVANRLLTFNVGNVIPGSSNYINVDLMASTSLVLGTLAKDTMWINPIAGDVTPTNNVSIIHDVVVGSWDPNDKAVSPKGEGEHGIVPVSTNEVSYNIRFQNTGTAPARTVQIRDAISSNIDLTTVKVTGASHEHTTEIIGNELVVTFANINLPDSSADYEASQGNIYVYAKLKPGLAIGAQIFNTAEIYFDFNAPVITNTVVTTLGSFVSGIDEAVNFDFAIMPNPAKNQISIRGEFEQGTVYELINQLGQTALSGTIHSNNHLVNFADLNTGFYLVKVKSGEKVGVKKLVIAK